jgi:hypothetical protein
MYHVPDQGLSVLLAASVQLLAASVTLLLHLLTQASVLCRECKYTVQSVHCCTSATPQDNCSTAKTTATVGATSAYTAAAGYCDSYCSYYY